MILSLSFSALSTTKNLHQSMRCALHISLNTSFSKKGGYKKSLPSPRRVVSLILDWVISDCSRLVSSLAYCCRSRFTVPNFRLWSRVHSSGRRRVMWGCYTVHTPSPTRYDRQTSGGGSAVSTGLAHPQGLPSHSACRGFSHTRSLYPGERRCEFWGFGESKMFRLNAWRIEVITRGRSSLGGMSLLGSSSREEDSDPCSMLARTLEAAKVLSLARGVSPTYWLFGWLHRWRIAGCDGKPHRHSWTCPSPHEPKTVTMVTGIYGYHSGSQGFVSVSIEDLGDGTTPLLLSIDTLEWPCRNTWQGQ